MKTRAMTKRERNAYEHYLKSNHYSLWSCYTTFSAKKYEAWKHCRDKWYEHYSGDLKVISYNTYSFTAGFTYKDEEGEHFVYITPSRTEDRLIV